MSRYFVSLLDSSMYGQYEAFLRENETTLLYCALSYKQMLESLLGCESRYLIAKDHGGAIVGALPVMLSKPGPYGPVANSLPYYGSNGAVTISPAHAEDASEIRRQLLDACMELLRNEECAAFTLITNPLDDTADWYVQYFGECLRDERIGQLTPLPPDGPDLESRLLAIFEDPRPRNIRKARKSGITWRVSHDPADFEFLCRTHQDNITAIGGIAKEMAFFSLVPEVFGKDEFRLYLAELHGTPVAGLLLFYFNRIVEYFTPATVEEFRSLQPLSLLIFEAMKDAAQQGCRYWNWGGTWLSQKGLYDFKRKWGSESHTYYYFTLVFREDILHTTPEILLKAYPNFFVVPFRELKS